MGQGRPEQRHDAVAHNLVHRPLVAVHGLHHPLEHWIEEFLGLLRIAVAEQLHRALEIGEEHRDLLALAFQCGLRVQDAFGQVPRRVRLGRGEAQGRGVCRRRARSCRMSTLRAELGRRGKLRPAADARPRQGCRALLAELRTGTVIVLAPGTLHPDPLGDGRTQAVDSALRSERWPNSSAGEWKGQHTDAPMRKSSTRPRQVRRVHVQRAYLGVG
jgi:hypothetical protein